MQIKIGALQWCIQCYTYTKYGMSTATPDNLRELLASHFTLDEIIKAKELLWDQCVMLKDCKHCSRGGYCRRHV